MLVICGPVSAFFRPQIDISKVIPRVWGISYHIEKYYQKIPLLVITADRPPEWIDQMDGQTIRQSGIYQNFIKGSYDLPVEVDNKDDRWYSQRIINEAIIK